MEAARLPGIIRSSASSVLPRKAPHDGHLVVDWALQNEHLELSAIGEGARNGKKSARAVWRARMQARSRFESAGGAIRLLRLRENGRRREPVRDRRFGRRRTELRQKQSETAM